MEKEQKLQVFSEIKRIERKLYLKKSQLAAAEAQEYKGKILTLSPLEGLDVERCRNLFSKLIEIIGRSSIGGNSVEDIRAERER